MNGSRQFSFNGLDWNYTAIFGIVAAALTYLGPPALAWIESHTGAFGPPLVIVLTAAGTAFVRWYRTNPDTPRV